MGAVSISHWTGPSSYGIVVTEGDPAMDTLATSREKVLKTIADNGVVLAHATAARMVGVHALAPAPRDPARHLEMAHTQARTHLVRLVEHDPAHPVQSFMTAELFPRLTDAQPAPLTAVREAAKRGGDGSVVYPGLYGVMHATDEVVELVLAIERELLAGTS